MAEDTRKGRGTSKRPAPGTGAARGAAGGTTRGATGTGATARTGGGSSRSRRPATTPGSDLERQREAGSGPGAGAADDTPPASAELGGATADGDGLTNATLIAAHLDADALDVAAEPIVIAQRITVLGASPAGDAVEGAADEQFAGPVDGRQRWLMIAERAYLRAADRGFVPGGELDDWLAAEQEVDAQLGGG